LDFWSAKNLATQSISYDYGLIIYTKMFSWLISFDIECNVMPFTKEEILKSFKTIDWDIQWNMDFFIKSFIHLN
jgi:hypothetical protein